MLFRSLENAMPIGYANLKILPYYTDTNVAFGNSVINLESCNINNVDYVVAFEADGRAEYLRLDTNTKGTVASAGTFSASGVRMKQWKNERAIISDPAKGYYTWDTVDLISVGSVGSGSTGVAW